VHTPTKKSVDFNSTAWELCNFMCCTSATRVSPRCFLLLILVEENKQHD
jgi:hypothetical protein